MTRYNELRTKMLDRTATPAEEQEYWNLQKAEEQPQDLAHHKTAETDTLVKAEHPADDFMRSKDLDKETHGKAQ